MRNLILNLVVVILSIQARANLLEAKPVKDMLDTVTAGQFQLSDTDMVFGFDSIKSCLFVSNDILVLRNYCSPKGNYPAKGYTFISPKFGIIEFYQETLSGVEKHDIDITVFSTDLRERLKGNLASMKIADINEILGYFYKRRHGGCWSSNFSFYTQKPDVACNSVAGQVVGFDDWSKESQNITADKAQWAKIISNLEDQLKE